MPWLSDENTELMMEAERRRRRKKARDRATPRAVAQLRDMQAAWPTLPARTKVLLTEQGITADSPVTREIAQLSVKTLAREEDRIRRVQQHVATRPSVNAVAGNIGPQRSREEAANEIPAITNTREAKLALSGTKPLSFEQVDQIWEHYDEMSGDERERLRQRLAGIDPSDREERAREAGRAVQDEPLTEQEELRLTVLRRYEGDLRRGDIPEGKNSTEQAILDSMRAELAGVDVQQVRRRAAGQAALGIEPAGGTPLNPQEQEDITKYLGTEQQAAEFNPVREGFEQAKGGLRAAGTAALLPGEFVTSQARQGIQRVRELAGGGPIIDRGEPGAPADVTGVQSSIEATTAGQVGRAILRGDTPDMGTGFFPDPQSPIGKAQAEAAREEGEFYGQAITPGRLVARGLTATGLINPKDGWYKTASGSVDAMVAVSQIGDPTNLLLDTYTAARQAKRLYAVPSAAPDEALKRGVVKNGVRDFLSPKTFDQTMSGSEGARLVNGLWEAKNANDFRYLRETVGDAGVAVKIIDAESKDQIPGILRGATGLEPSPGALAGEVGEPVLFEPPKLPGVSYTVTKPLDNVRMFHDMPRGGIDIHDVNRGLDTFDAMQRNAKLPAALREENNVAFARSVSRGGGHGPNPEVFPIIEKTYADIVESEVTRFSKTLRARVGGEEAVEEFRRSATRKHGKVFLDAYQDARRYVIDEYGNNARLPWVSIDGAREAAPEPSRFVEFLSRTVPVPDTREVRKATSWMTGAYNTPVVKQLLEGSTTALDFFYTQAFKPLALITRFAYPVRVLGEEQFRIAGAGYDSLFSGHAASYIALATGMRGKGATSADDFAKAAVESAMTGAPDEFAQAMSRGSGPIRLLDDPGDIAAGMRLKSRMRYRQGEDRFATSWAEELLKDHNDPVVRGIAALSPGDAKEAFWRGNLAPVRTKMIRNGGGWENLAEREWSDKYVDFLYDHVKNVTRDDPELLAAVVSGKVGDAPLIQAGRFGKGVGKPRINPDVVRVLDDRAVAGNAPEWIPGDQVVRLSRGEKGVQALDNLVQSFFTGMMGFPTDNLSRGPVFKQAFWNRAAELLPYAKDQKAIDDMFKLADDMNVGKRVRAHLETAAARTKIGEGRLAFSDMETLAKAHGLDETRDLLYDLAKRNQVFDALRFVFPFGDAFKEVAGTWIKLFRENPKAYYRFQQGLQGGREAGFFHEDAYGQEVFTYPGTEMLTEKLVGVPIPLDGPIANLNLVGQGYPGVGPAVQWAAAWGLPDKPAFDVINELIFPYGRPENKDPLSLAVDSVTPAWFDKISAAFGSPLGEELMNKTTARMAVELRSTGEYGEGPDEQRRLMNDARDKAQTFLVIQGLAQNVAPSTPIPEFQVFDKDGQTMAMAKVSEEYYNRRTEDGQEAAIDWLVRNFGKDARGVLAGISSDLVFGLVDEKAAYDWERNHSGFMDKYPNIGGFFAPRAEKPEFDLNVYGARQDKGQSIIPDPEVTNRVANDIFARFLYDKEVEWADGHLEDEEYARYLRDQRAYLRDAYPGFESDVGEVGKADVDERIEEIKRAVKDSTVRGTPAAKAIKEYLAERQWAEQEAKKLGITNWWTAKSTRHVVEYLSDFQTYLRGKYGRPANDVLDQVFSRDVSALEEE